MGFTAALVCAGVLALGGAAISGAAVSPRIHRTCPKSGRHVARTHDPAAAQQLVAQGADSVLLCRYHGLNPMNRYGRLDYARRVTKRATIAYLTRGLDALKPYMGPPRVVSCALGTDAKVVAYFQYGAAREWTVNFELLGCGWVRNGRTVRGPTRLTGYVGRLTHYPGGPDS